MSHTPGSSRSKLKSFRVPRTKVSTAPASMVPVVVLVSFEHFFAYVPEISVHSPRKSEKSTPPEPPPLSAPPSSAPPDGLGPEPPEGPEPALLPAPPELGPPPPACWPALPLLPPSSLGLASSRG